MPTFTSLLDLVSGLTPIQQALLGTSFGWFMTAAGASLVFFVRTIRQRTLDGMLGFAAGVMIAASYWSLLAPAIAMVEEAGGTAWLPALIGFLGGGAFLWCIDQVLPHVHLDRPRARAEGVSTTWRRSVLLVLAVTLHNIPEGMAVGVSFGSAGAEVSGASVAAAVVLALGIGIQNFPEGAAISLPLRREGLSRGKAFFWGQISGFAEPVAGLAAAALVLWFRPILPYSLAFAAGAMIYVVVEELIPESQQDPESDAGTVGLLLGFSIMMVLDVALG